MLYNEIADIKRRRRERLLMMHGGMRKDLVRDNINVVYQNNVES
jgi:hypothetical protein